MDFENMNLLSWIKRELRDMEEKNPGLFNKSLDVLKEIARYKEQESTELYKIADRMSNEAMALEEYINAIEQKAN